MPMYHIVMQYVFTNSLPMIVCGQHLGIMCAKTLETQFEESQPGVLGKLVLFEFGELGGPYFRKTCSLDLVARDFCGRGGYG